MVEVDFGQFDILTSAFCSGDFWLMVLIYPLSVLLQAVEAPGGCLENTRK
jgi:hypothetical protein